MVLASLVQFMLARVQESMGASAMWSTLGGILSLATTFGFEGRRSIQVTYWRGVVTQQPKLPELGRLRVLDERPSSR